MAVRLAPSSPEVLRRAAEGELLAEEWDDAAYLADRSLTNAPFNAKALRVRGLAAARMGDTARADQMLTLAGNWSLRDDPAHAWLVEHRLRQGSYSSAFAHADTLARRRPDLHQQVFNLFTTAAIQDPRAMPPLVGLVAAEPPWRASFLNTLQRREDGDALLLAIGVALQETRAPLSDAELSSIYYVWSRERRFTAMGVLRRKLRRPSLEREIQDGAFSQKAQAQLPAFGWTLGTAAGLMAEVTEDDLRPGNRALRVHHDGYGDARIAQQLLLLNPGRYIFSVRFRQENESRASMEWTLTCVEGGAPLMRLRLPESVGSNLGKWDSLTAGVEVPDRCAAQRLALAPRSADRRSPLSVWFDDVELRSSR